MVSTIIQGGLGNNLYMMGALFGFAKKHGFEYAIPLKIKNPHYKDQKPYIFPGLNYCDKVPDLPLYTEPYFHYAEIPAHDNIILNGYFQSFRYIEPFRDEFIKALGLKWELYEGWCAVHCRRGDYLRLPDFHPFVGEMYLENAVKEINKLTGIKKFKVFSNDIPWCKDFFPTVGDYTFDFVEGNSEIEDMRQGSCCEHQILSNGTFALWQYYLNQNPYKICTAPFRWFGKKLPHNTRDLYPENAIILPNE